MSISVKLVHANDKRPMLMCGAPIRKYGGFVGLLNCRETGMKVYEMTPVWEGKFPRASCGGEHEKSLQCDVVAPGFEHSNAVMIDDFTYIMKLDIP